MALQDNVLTVPLDKLNCYKFIILILKKLELGHVLSSTLQLNNVLKLYFDTNILLQSKYSAIYNYKNQRCKVYSISDTDKNQDKLINIKFTITEMITIDDNFINKYNPYIIEEKDIHTISTFQLKLPYNGDKLEINDDHIKKIQKSMLIFQNYNEYYHIYKYFSALEYVAINNNRLDKKSILQFQKNSKYFSFFNNAPDFPTIDKIKTVIDIIVNNGKTLKELTTESLTIKFSNFTVVYNMNNLFNKLKIIIKVGPFIVFSGQCIETFKYIFHPGLYTFVKYLDISNNITNLDLSIQKHLFKKV